MLPERKASPLSPQQVLASAVVSTHVDTYGSVPTSWGQSLNGECLSCGVTGSVWKVSRVAARSFTAWSQQPHMLRTGAGEGWCRFCGLLVSASELRREWWHVTSAPRVEQLSALSLQAVLSSPVLQSDAVTAGPTGRQNLLLRMRWGCVATMWGVWPWGDREVGMFQAVLLESSVFACLVCTRPLRLFYGLIQPNAYNGGNSSGAHCQTFVPDRT